MKIFTTITTLFLSITVAATSCTLSYEDSIEALAFNQVDPYDGSAGTVWFNTTGYFLEEYGFNMIDDYGIKTYTTFNYLMKLLELVTIADQNARHGDIVFILYKYLYAGNKDATEIKEGTDMMNDIAEMLKGANAGRTKGNLTDILIQTSSVQVLVDMYQLAAEMAEVHNTDKHWIKQAYSTAHQTAKSAFATLLKSFAVVSDWHFGGLRNIEYRGWFIFEPHFG